MRLRDEITKTERVAGRIKAVDWRRLLDVLQTKQPSVLDGFFVQEQIVAMQVDRHAERSLRCRNTGDVVNVCVGQQDTRQRDLLTSGKLEQALDFVARINDHAFARPRTRHDESIFEEWADRLRLDYDHLVILAILDDLLFTSKMRATAKHVGATLSVAKSREAALAEMRASTPALVILDLNNPRVDPLGIVAEMKGDPALAGIATVGFVSHVQTELIDAARKAGVGDVMARSLFAERLPQILARGL
jgi:PleD family two-component response regulator